MTSKILFFFISITTQVYAQSEEELHEKGFALLEAEKYSAALPYFNKLVDINPEVITYRYYNRAVTLFNLKQYEKAILDYSFLVIEDPENPEYPFQIGNIYEHMDNLKQAQLYYSKAITLDNENYFYFFKRGTVVLKNLQWKDAIEDFNKALELNPEHDNSYHNRGIAHYKIGFKEKGCEDWCQALLRGNPKSAIHLEKNCKVYPQPCLPSK